MAYKLPPLFCPTSIYPPLSTCALRSIFLPVTCPLHLPKLLAFPSSSLILPITVHFFSYLPLNPTSLLLLCLFHRENKGNNSIGSRIKSLSNLDDDEDVFEKPVIVPRTRTFPARSYTIDTPYSSSEPPERSLKEDKPPAASPAIGRAASPPTTREVDIVDSPAVTTTAITSTSRSSHHSSQSPAAAPLQRSPVSEHSSTVKTEEITTIISSSSSMQKVPEPRRPLSGIQTEVEAPSSGSLYKQQPQLSSMEPKPPGVSRVSASLPRSYQRSDSARLTSVVAPRPFGTQSSRITSLPRAFTVSTR